jgi:hypothetical protein
VCACCAMTEPAVKTLKVIKQRTIDGMGRRNIFMVALRVAGRQKYS